MSPTARQHCEEALRLIERARREPPARLSTEVDDAERLLVRVRDALIEERRRDAGVPRATLDHVNAALSLVVGVEYPSAGIQRQALEQAVTAIHAALASGPV